MNINVKVKYNRIYSLKNENQCPFTIPNKNIIVVTNRQSLNEWISELFLPYQTNLCYSCKYPTQRTEESLLCLKLKWKSYWTEKWFDNKKPSLHKTENSKRPDVSHTTLSWRICHATQHDNQNQCWDNIMSKATILILLTLEVEIKWQFKGHTWYDSSAILPNQPDVLVLSLQQIQSTYQTELYKL